MNQYFKVTGGEYANVESVQLEFAKEGIRVRGKIAPAGTKVAKAIAALVGCETVNIREEEANESLVKEATEKVMDFISANHKNNVAVGHYLIEKFYDANYEKAKKGNASKGKSLNAMLDGLQKTGNAPSKSWFYNAVNLAVDDKEFENNEDYKKLNLSHKIHLTYLNKKDEYQSHKKALITEIANKGMEIKTLRERISFIKGKSEPANLPSVDDLAKMKEDEIVKHREKAEKRKEAIQRAIDKLNEKIAAQQAELAKCDEFLNAVVGSTMSQAA
jgi:hypothetical protein